MESALNAKYDVVFLWKQNDSGFYGRRADMVLKELASHERVGKIIHFDPPIAIDFLEEFRASTDDNSHNRILYDLTMDAYMGRKKIYGVNSYTYIYSYRDSGRTDFTTMESYFDYVKKMLEKNGIGEENEVLLWNCPINFDLSLWIDLLNPAYIVSDFIDDQRAWYQDEESLRRINENFQLAIEKSGLILVNCEEMHQRVLGMGGEAEKKLRLVKNGCEGYIAGGFEKPDFLKTLEGPVVGMTGNLEKKIDVELLEKCASRHPEWNIVLIGSTHASEDIGRLYRYGNVYFCGPVPYEEAKKYISFFDVAVIANRVVSINEAMNPLKLYVYCSLGVSVVSTDIPGIDELKGMIRVAGSHDEFVEQVEMALRERHIYSETDIRLINDISWKNKVDQIFGYISNPGEAKPETKPERQKKAPLSFKRLGMKLPVVKSLYRKWKRINDSVKQQQHMISGLEAELKQSEAEHREQIEQLHAQICTLGVLAQRGRPVFPPVEGIEPYGQSPLVSIAIVNRSGPNRTREILSAIERCGYGNYEVVLASHLPPDERFCADGKPYQAVSIEKDMGYAEAVNLVSAQTKGDLMVLLENTGRMSDGWLADLVAAFLSFNNVGAVGGILKDSYGFSKGICFDETIHEGYCSIRPYTVPVDMPDIFEEEFVERACLQSEGLLVDLQKFREAGGMESCFGSGYEGIDLTLKLFRLGYRNYVSGRVIIERDENHAWDEKKTGSDNGLFRNKWESWLSRQILDEKINGREVVSKGKLVLGIIGMDDKAGIPGPEFASFLSEAELEGYHTKKIPYNWMEDGYEVGAEVDVLVVAGDTAQEKPLMNMKDSLIKISRLQDSKENNMGCESNMLLKEVIQKTNAFQIQPRTIDILGSMPFDETKKYWGDYHFANSLKKEFKKRGYVANVKSYPEWPGRSNSEYVLVLRGGYEYYPKAEKQKTIMWNISHPDMVSLEDYSRYDLVYVASDRLAEELSQKLDVPVKALLQCTDEEVMSYDDEQERYELLFIGNTRSIGYRQIINDVLPTDYKLSVYGDGWPGRIPQENFAGPYIDNAEIGQAYHSAKIVLNDHWEDMKEYGFVSNRLFDVLAAQAFVISDDIPEIHDLFDGCVETYTTKEELKEKIDYYMQNAAERKEKAKKGREIVLKEHTFSKRVGQIVKDMESLL